MEKRVAMFIDGESFRHSIEALFEDFDKTQYLPKAADWESFFDWLVSRIEHNGERMRTYWYVLKHIEFYPFRVPKDTLTDEAIDEELRRFPEYDGPGHMTPTESAQALWRKKEQMKRRFEGWTRVQNGIATHHRNLEFRRAGAIKYNLFTGQFTKEKAIDVKLATDLIILKDVYDTAVIVAGDQDLIPAVQVAKDCGKRVINVTFRKQTGEMLPSGINRLNQHTDARFYVQFSDLEYYMNIGMQ